MESTRKVQAADASLPLPSVLCCIALPPSLSHKVSPILYPVEIENSSARLKSVLGRQSAKVRERDVLSE